MFFIVKPLKIRMTDRCVKKGSKSKMSFLYARVRIKKYLIKSCVKYARTCVKKNTAELNIFRNLWFLHDDRLTGKVKLSSRCSSDALLRNLSFGGKNNKEISYFCLKKFRLPFFVQFIIAL